MVYEAGELVQSLAGRDAGRVYVILSIKEDMLLLADGRSRSVEKPKGKKKKHVQLIHERNAEVTKKIAEGTVQDADLVYAIHCYKGECKCQNQM